MPPQELNGDLSFQAKLMICLVCAFGYFYAFQLNSYLFSHLKFAHGVNWVFLPSGLRLLLVLMMFEYGAIGVALGSIAVNYLGSEHPDNLFEIGTGLISGFAPLLARTIAVDVLKLGGDLEGLTPKVFIIITVLFAAISATLHQLWFYWNGVSDNFVFNSMVMAIGDWTGTVLVLAAASLLIKLSKLFISQR